MAEKDFLLANKSRELLKYTKHKTKVVSDDISRKDARAIFHKIAQLDDIEQIRAVCSEAVEVIDRTGKEGFTKANFRLYGEDMRQIAKSIMRGIRAANRANCNTQSTKTESAGSTMCWTTAVCCWTISRSASKKRSSTSRHPPPGPRKLRT